MQFPKWPVAVAMALIGAGCGHSVAYDVPDPVRAGPFGSGPSLQLTFNADQDYWPTWTADGRGILYAFVDAESAVLSPHRCLGLIPAGGGTRLWQMCDDRAVRNDTVSSYGAYALSADGKLLVAEAIAPTNFPVEPVPTVLLWLSDTAHPYVRTTLLTLPATFDGFSATWLADLAWTGPNTFIGLAQQLETLPHCGACACFPCPRDSVFSDAGMVVVGTITGRTATLHAIAGTDSATSYSLAEDGASIVFTRHHDLRLFKVPIGGGAPVPVPIQRTVPDTAALITAELAGVSCKGSTCVVASDGILLTDAYSSPLCIGGVCELFANYLVVPGLPPTFRPMMLQLVSLSTGVTTLVQQDTGGASQVFASPRISPTSGDVVVQRGGVWGHLQTYATAGRGNGHLFLFKGIVQ